VNAKITSFSAKKRMGIVKAAHDLFLDQGYELTSMDDIAARARVSKPTVYSHFRDKEALFAEVVRATTDDVADLVSLVSRSLADPEDFELKLLELARKFLTALMQPQMLKLRRMVIANAERFPEVGRLWYEQGFERVLRTLADCFQRLADRTVLKLDDPMIAAQHFVGLLLWIPLNKIMFTGDRGSSKVINDRTASAAVRAFLAAYSKGRKTT
jgi:TetR/AcrR family transcriptional repressor of mexJK operon